MGHSLYLSGVMDGFYLHMKVAIIGGVIIASPIWLYQHWAFVAPGLYAKETALDLRCFRRAAWSCRCSAWCSSPTWP